MLSLRSADAKYKEEGSIAVRGIVSKSHTQVLAESWLTVSPAENWHMVAALVR